MCGLGKSLGEWRTILKSRGHAMASRGGSRAQLEKPGFFMGGRAGREWGEDPRVHLEVQGSRRGVDPRTEEWVVFCQKRVRRATDAGNSCGITSHLPTWSLS